MPTDRHGGSLEEERGAHGSFWIAKLTDIVRDEKVQVVPSP